MIYEVVTFLYKRVGNEKATVHFQRLALKYRISNNLLQDTKNFWNGQILFNRRKITAESTSYCNSNLKIEGFIFSDNLIKGFQTFVAESWVRFIFSRCTKMPHFK